MASETPAPEDFDMVELDDDQSGGDVETVRLEPGEELIASVRHIERDVGRYGNSVLHLTRPSGEPIKYWSNATIDRRLEAADVGPGDRVLIRKSEDSYTFTDDDGEEQTAHEFEVGVKKA